MNETKNIKRILIAEDENIVGLDIESALKNMGYHVLSIVSSGEEAIVTTGLLRPDLVLMDIQLNGEVDGIEAAKYINNQYHVPVIFLTAHADESTLERAKEAEPYWYLLKPFEERELHTAIEIVLLKHQKILERESAAQEEINTNQDRFNMFTDSIFDYAVFMLDLNGNIQTWNTGSTRILGYGAEEVLGKNIDLFYKKADREQGLDKLNLSRALRSGKHLSEQTLLRRDGSTLEVEMATVLMYDKDGRAQGFGSILHDVHTIKETERVVDEVLRGHHETQ